MQFTRKIAAIVFINFGLFELETNAFVLLVFIASVFIIVVTLAVVSRNTNGAVE